MRNKGKVIRLLSAALALILCASLYAGGAFALFSSSPDAVIVRFTTEAAQSVSIELLETKMEPVVDAAGNRSWQPAASGDMTQRNDFTGITAGDRIPRNVEIRNNGDINVWVRAELKLDKISAFNKIGIADPSQLFEGIDADKWELASVKDNAEEDSRTWTYCYKKVLNAPQTGADGQKTYDSTGSVLSGVIIPDNLTAEQLAGINGFTLSCTAAAVQAEGFDSAKSAFEAAFPDK